VGVVPYYDMLNHCSSEEAVSVHLESVGQAVERMREGEKIPEGMNERDMLIVASRDIREGEELLTSYVDGEGDEVDARKLVTWGFI
jgi:hypothetical protein